MALLARKMVILAAIESTYGSDVSPTGSANAILVRNPDLTPLNAQTTQRNTVRPTLGRELQIHYGVHVQLQFEVEIAGGGAADTPPAWAPLLKACGFSETVNSGTSVEYDPVSTGFESLTLYFFMDGQKHAMTGARGSVSMSFDPDSGFPVFTFNFTGLWVDPTSTSNPTPDYSSFQMPVVVDNNNTPTFDFFGNSHEMLALSLDMGNQVTYRNVVGDESVEIVDREPGGSLTIQAPPLSTIDYFDKAKSNALGDMNLTHGQNAGNIVELSFPAAASGGGIQPLNPSYGESDGIATLEMDLALVPSDGGDDEIKITTK